MKKFAITTATIAALGASALGFTGIASAAPGDHFANPGLRSFCMSLKGSNNAALLKFNKAAAQLADEEC